MEECSAVGCYLQEHGGLVSFPLITIAGLADGVNPCAIGMILMLLGYLIVFAKKPQRVLVIGLMFYSFVREVQAVINAGLVNRVVGFGLGVAGLIMLKDVIWPESPLHLQIPEASKEKLLGLIERVSLPATVLLGISVTILETPCSLPLYVGTATVLANSGLALPVVILYFLYYNFLFVAPLIVVLFLVWKGKQIAEIKEWEHRAQRWMKLLLGELLTLMSAWLIFG